MITRVKHVASGKTAEVVNIRGQMFRLRWEDGVEDEYHITQIQNLLDSGSWDVVEQR